jgi:hypothetical protein
VQICIPAVLIVIGSGIYFQYEHWLRRKKGLLWLSSLKTIETNRKTTDGRKLITKGYANIPLSAPGLGIELNDDAVKEHLHPSDKSFFAANYRVGSVKITRQSI